LAGSKASDSSSVGSLQLASIAFLYLDIIFLSIEARLRPPSASASSSPESSSSECRETVPREDTSSLSALASPGTLIYLFLGLALDAAFFAT